MSYNLLKGKKGIIFGALDENSIAWKVAERAYEEKASFILTNTPASLRMGKIHELSHQTESMVIPADATSIVDLNILFDKTLDHFGGKIDFILHSIAMSINIRKGNPYTSLNYDFLRKGWEISSVSYHKIMQTAWNKNAMNKWGSIVAITYVASQRSFPHYGDMSDYKSYLESITRNFGYHWGIKKKVRVNTVSQSPSMTKSAKSIKGFDQFFIFSEKISPLGNASAQDCANYIITLFSDFTRKVTMQNLYHDGGFSKTGIIIEPMIS
ncbi:MAG: SDR family oxidoreductase [Flavobacteriales bacterium]|jgi:enoyl-[acyl-carrier protein] reductase I|uniref:enoyl-ACP reductase FabI n=1 Tax=Blattabacterium sp. (Mastotermes darwiniensis) TaxID=39768 RepID=UPI000231DF79|nr:SDR family oxidoreductase [Blattabacterium sp. (Mastotermes darwiniensis)]AER40401.1 enoyl-[acyl-carrier-protein] reductase (NADH) [Blattabacterium sp. (Mastotermes darwiniensis) str. MADAR]MDR1804878.1 SDR family oxidoreductase [Flavobacteriales bacterium]